MRYIIVLLFAGLISSQALAQDFGLTVGFRNNNADTDVANSTVEAGTGLQLGGLGFFPFNDLVWFRGGFLYTQRYADIVGNNGALVAEVHYAYLDIPLTVMFKFSEYGGVFAGPILALNQSKECSSPNTATCQGINVKSTIMPISLGASFKFAPQMGGEFVYEFYSGDLSDDFSNMRSIGLNFIVFFQ